MEEWSSPPYHYQDKVEDHQRTQPANAYAAETACFRARSQSTPAKYAVKGGVALQGYTEEPRGTEEHRRGEYLQDSGGGYAPDSAESTDADMSYESQAHMRYKKREPHSRRPLTSTQAQIAQLEHQRALLIEEIQHVDHIKENYSNQLQHQTSLLMQKSPSSPEYTEIRRNMQRIVEDAYATLGTDSDQKLREQDWRQRLLEIEHRLASFKQSRFQPVSSPENSQVSGHEPHWSPYSSTADGYTDPLPHHRPPQMSEDSGFCADNHSDVTGSSQTQQRRPPIPYGTHQIPEILRPSTLVRSASTDDNLVAEPNEVVEALAQTHLGGRHGRTHRRATSGSIPLSQYSDHYPRGGFQSPSQLSLSQNSSHTDPYHYVYPRKRGGSPASSSDTGSIASDAWIRLASQPGSMISFPSSILSTSTASSLNSSRSGSKGSRLPRPPRRVSNSSSFNSRLPYMPHTMSEIGFTTNGYKSSQVHSRHSDSEHEEEPPRSMPELPITSKAPPTVPVRAAPPPPSHRTVKSSSKVVPRIKKVHPKIPEETSRDSLQMKIEMVLSVLSVVNSSSREQNDKDAVKFLLALSRTPDTCAVMRQPGCMNMLIQILHNIQHKGDRSHREVRARAAETLRNIIQSTGDTRQGKHELCVLGVLEKIRSHCDSLFEFITSHEGSRRIDPAKLESLQADCDELLQLIRKLYKYSNDKEKYRPAILNIGGLQATAEVLIVNFRLIAFQDTVLRPDQKPVCHSSKIITAIISILINLTYGDVNNKSDLCNLPDFLKSLVFHIKQQNESIIASSAQVLRNLSWRATADIKEALHKCDAAVALTAAIKYISDEPTIQYTTSALWNLSAHSLESRRRVCSTHIGIQQLVELLSYNSPSGTSAVVENVGGILKNLSVVIMQEEKYRRKFREAGGFAKLAQHLKSKNKTVLANATGTLWNLSARCPEDQRLLWSLGCVPLLDVHATSEHKSIGENARGALRNLLAFGQHNGYSSKSDVDGYNLKTQQGLSKSLCYASFGQPAAQHTQKHSSESLHSRSSQPLPSRSKSGGAGSTFSLNPGESRRHDYQYPGVEDMKYPQKSKNKLKLSRIGSAPQASVSKDDEIDEKEWTSYMPYQEKERGHFKPYADEPPRHKKKSKSRSGGHPYSLSQTVSSSELHAVSMSLSPGAHLSNDVPPSLTALEAGFDPNQPERTHEVYAELDPLDLEDDCHDDIDLPIRREEHSSAADLYPSPRASRHDGTGKLALDGSVIRVDQPGEKC